MSHSKTIYFRSIDRRWETETRRNPTGAVFVSPFLTSPTAQRIIGKAKSSGSEETRVYTCFKAELFLSGASSLKTLKTLNKMGYKLFHLDELHAKVVITEDFASIGSQNLTARGRRNQEATVVLTDRREIALVRREVNRWAEQATPITNQMLDYMDAALGRLCTRYTALADEMVLIDQEVQEAEANRRDRRAQAKRRLKALSRTICKFHLKKLGEAGNVPLETAECLIRKSIGWPLPSGFRRPKGWADHIEKGKYGWQISFRFNKFLVGRATSLCKAHINSFLNNIENETYESLADLRDQLEQDVQGSVTNKFGRLYKDKKAAPDKVMHFGATTIDLEDFVNAIFELTKIDELENLLEEVVEQDE